jgi:hypothetical protein
MITTFAITVPDLLKKLTYFAHIAEGKCEYLLEVKSVKSNLTSFGIFIHSFIHSSMALQISFWALASSTVS